MLFIFTLNREVQRFSVGRFNRRRRQRALLDALLLTEFAVCMILRFINRLQDDFFCYKTNNYYAILMKGGVTHDPVLEKDR